MRCSTRLPASSPNGLHLELVSFGGRAKELSPPEAGSEVYQRVAEALLMIVRFFRRFLFLSKTSASLHTIGEVLPRLLITAVAQIVAVASTTLGAVHGCICDVKKSFQVPTFLRGRSDPDAC